EKTVGVVQKIGEGRAAGGNDAELWAIVAIVRDDFRSVGSRVVSEVAATVRSRANREDMGKGSGIPPCQGGINVGRVAIVADGSDDQGAVIPGVVHRILQSDGIAEIGARADVDEQAAHIRSIDDGI